MPGYKAHIAGGLVVGGIGAYLLYTPGVTWTCQTEWLLFSCAGALFPDIDVKSKGQHYFYWLVLFLLAWCALEKHYDRALGISVLAVVPLLARHRGLFHRMWFVICMPLLVWFLLSDVPRDTSLNNALLIDSYFFIAGALSHLWLDMGLKRMMRLR